jgi:hypothetical protein
MVPDFLGNESGQSVGALERWSVGALERWNGGTVERWSVIGHLNSVFLSIKEVSV